MSIRKRSWVRIGHKIQDQNLSKVPLFFDLPGCIILTPGNWRPWLFPFIACSTVLCNQEASINALEKWSSLQLQLKYEPMRNLEETVHKHLYTWHFQIGKISKSLNWKNCLKISKSYSFQTLFPGGLWLYEGFGKHRHISINLGRTPYCLCFIFGFCCKFSLEFQKKNSAAKPVTTVSFHRGGTGSAERGM